ncbi:MAG: hypothetical protein RL497_2021 [Pseudomonadota bacterium]
MSPCRGAIYRALVDDVADSSIGRNELRPYSEMRHENRKHTEMVTIKPKNIYEKYFAALNVTPLASFADRLGASLKGH